ncbi:MAG: potassium/proton antiporter [Planctomycetes bacterium]|nr:potassium/proton antiporter [Planctomycetota bacterium]
MTEPLATAVVIALFGALLTFSTLLSRVLDRCGVPVALLFLVLGMLGGSEGIGGLHFDDAELAFRVGTVALILILLDGGLNTKYAAVRAAAVPAGLLATFGVIGTATIVALAGRAFGLDWSVAVLTGAIVSSTDAAAVFGVLRGSGIRLEAKVQSTLEVESCANDPMAVILTLTIADVVATQSAPSLATLMQIPLQIVLGTAVGVACGFGFRFLLNSIRLSAQGLYPVLIVASAFTAFGASTLIYGSGFLAVFVSSVVVGNGHIPFAPGLRRVHDSLAWLCQVTMFLMLGLLVFPSRLMPLSGAGIGLGLVLAFLARPAATFICLGALRWPRKQILVAGWVGLRGAVPIVLATIPVMKGLAIGDQVFHLVFFVVVVSAIIPGASIVPAALWTRLGRRVPTPPGYELELNLRKPLSRELQTIAIGADSRACGKSLRELALPDSLAIVLVIRDEEPIPARGSTLIEAGDLLYVVAPTGSADGLASIMGPESPPGS